MVAATGVCLVGGVPAAHAVGPATVRVSVSSAGVQARTLVTVAPAGVSDTGRWVLMSSKSSRLVAGDTNGRYDAFLHNTTTGTTVRVSVSSSGRQANGASIADALSPDGRFVLFSSGASNLLLAADTNHTTDVFLRDRTLGITRRVSIPPAGGQVRGSSKGVAVSADGRFVLFTTHTIKKQWWRHPRRTYLRDRLRNTTTRVGRIWSKWVVDGRALSANGRMVAYVRAGQKDEGDTLYIHDRATGQTTDMNRLPGWTFDPSVSSVRFSPDGQEALITGQSTTAGGNAEVSVWKAGGPVTQITNGPHGSSGIGVSDDGSMVAFVSEDPTLVPGDTNHAVDVFVRNLTTGTTQRVDLSATGAQIPQGVQFDHWPPVAAVASLSGDGRYVAFDSADPTVVSGDTNATIDVFLRGPLF
jgi:TolB protein